MTHPFVRLALCVTALGLAPLASAQTDIDWSGLAWIDYAYLIADPDDALEGSNSFDYRRIYLTADARPTESVRVRLRLEAQGGATTDAGRPSPFVKDAWARWTYSEAGHSATVGVQPPPLFQLSESVWGYRSLERTLIDRFQSSRDFGLRVDGPLALDGDLRYAAMIANGRGIRPEPVGEAGKHVYGQLQYRPAGSPLRASVGADYVAVVPFGVEPEAGPEPERESGLAFTGFVGAVADRVRVGLKGFVNHQEFDRAGDDVLDSFGVSAFAIVDPTPNTSIIARYDYSDADATTASTNDHFVVAGVGVRPAPALEVLPNVIARFRDDVDATVTARITVTATF